MSHSPHGECDFDSQGTDETTGSQQPDVRAHDVGSGGHADGCQHQAHEAYAGGLPGEGSCRSCPRPPGSQSAQCYPRGRFVRCGSYGWHQVPRGQPHPSQRVAERTRGHRHRQDHAQTHPGQRRAEESTKETSAQAPGTPPANAPGGDADPGGRQLPPVVGGSGSAVHVAARSG